jgi:hypothetical protein
MLDQQPVTNQIRAVVLELILEDKLVGLEDLAFQAPAIKQLNDLGDTRQLEHILLEAEQVLVFSLGPMRKKGFYGGASIGLPEELPAFRGALRQIVIMQGFHKSFLDKSLVSSRR